ncbi:hypothetical protein BKA83DRAFT_9947 [Pisolithus microcarpus]|nr:hypothetical protein BKA83DRAFT_9947 [Pisolithus microcarpus]
MAGLPPKPDFLPRTQSTWPDKNDAKITRSSPDRHYHPRDDRRDNRDRDYRDRDRDRDRRPYRSRSPSRSMMDSYIAGSHPASPSKGTSPTPKRCTRDDRDRRGGSTWDRWPPRYPDRDREREREFDYRRGREASTSTRRRPFDQYDRERDDRRHDRWHPSPGYRRDSRSPPPRRGDHYSGRARSPPRRPPPRIPSPSRAIRSPSPQCRSIKLDPDEPHHPRYDRDRIRESGSPRRYSRSPSPAYRRHLPRRSRSRSRTRLEGSPSPARYVKQEPVDDIPLGGARHPEEHPTSTPLSHVKKEEEWEERVEWRRKVPSPRREVKKESPSELAHVKEAFLPIHAHAARSPSPSVSEKERERERERQREHQQEREREKEKKPTQPFLPPIPRYEPRPKFSTTLAHEAEHELDMATLELRAAQHRRELAETLRKRAHAGVLGIDATAGVGTNSGKTSVCYDFANALF